MENSSIFHPRNDLSGKRFGRLVAISVVERRKNRALVWRCLCDCGNTKDVLASSLVSGKTSSCGCLHSEQLIEYNHTKLKHGGSKERLYPVWLEMIKRCENPTDKNYCGRGIQVCDEWRDYKVFRAWAYKNGFVENAKRGECTLDRIDNDGNYEPSNCRWTTQKVQTNNTRVNVRYNLNGEYLTLAEIANRCGAKYIRLYYLVHHGRSIEQAILEA